LRAAHFILDAVLAVTKEGLLSFLRARGEEKWLNSYEEPLVIIEALGLMGMPRRDDILTLFKEMSEDKAFDIFLETPYIFAFAGLATPPALNNDKKYGIRARAELSYVKTYTTMIEDSRYKPEDSADHRWLKLDYAIERVKKIISVYEHKASHSNYYCYADMADALRLLYEKERTACRSYI
jgi:hypothetical protein